MLANCFRHHAGAASQQAAGGGGGSGGAVYADSRRAGSTKPASDRWPSASQPRLFSFPLWPAGAILCRLPAHPHHSLLFRSVDSSMAQHRVDDPSVRLNAAADRGDGGVDQRAPNKARPVFCLRLVRSVPAAAVRVPRSARALFDSCVRSAKVCGARSAGLGGAGSAGLPGHSGAAGVDSVAAAAATCARDPPDECLCAARGCQGELVPMLSSSLQTKESQRRGRREYATREEKQDERTASR